MIRQTKRCGQILFVAVALCVFVCPSRNCTAEDGAAIRTPGGTSDRHDAPPPAMPPRPVAVLPREKDLATNRDDHLRRAAEHLAAAGEDALAQHVRGLCFDTRPASAGPSPKQVLLHIKILEVDREVCRRHGWDIEKVPVLTESQASRGLFSAFEPGKVRRVLAEPTLVTTVGRPATFHSGGEALIWKHGSDGRLVQCLEPYGILGHFVVKQEDHGQLGIDLALECSEVDTTRTVPLGEKENPLIRRRTIKTPLTLEPGESRIAVSFPLLDHATDNVATDAASPALLLLLTVELVAPGPAMQN